MIAEECKRAIKERRGVKWYHCDTLPWDLRSLRLYFHSSRRHRSSSACASEGVPSKQKAQYSAAGRSARMYSWSEGILCGRCSGRASCQRGRIPCDTWRVLPPGRSTKGASRSRAGGASPQLSSLTLGAERRDTAANSVLSGSRRMMPRYLRCPSRSARWLQLFNGVLFPDTW